MGGRGSSRPNCRRLQSSATSATEPVTLRRPCPAPGWWAGPLCPSPSFRDDTRLLCACQGVFQGAPCHGLDHQRGVDRQLAGCTRAKGQERHMHGSDRPLRYLMGLWATLQGEIL